MNFLQQTGLANYSTMGLGGRAAYVCEVTSRMEVLEALSWAQTHNVPAIMIGGGSNIIWRDEGFPGLLIVNNILRYEVFEEDETNVYLTVGAGEPWDSVVERSVAAGLTGIEALSLIPGKTGATPIQNVGAYGQDVSQTLTTIEAFDTQASDFVTLAGSDCAFGYRTSRFKTTDRGRFFITAVTLHLRRANPEPPFYGSVQTYFDEHDIHGNYTPALLRQAVTAIRTAKLPDPAEVKNAGSFFANPVIPEDQFVQLNATYPAMPHWKTDNGIKLSAAWLVEQIGLGGYRDETTGMATWPEQPLVFVNENAETTADLLTFKKQVVDSVQDKFGITLQQEPELLPPVQAA